MTRAPPWSVLVVLGLLAAPTSSERAAAQACATEQDEVFRSPHPLGPRGITLAAVRGRVFGAWIVDTGRVAVLDLTSQTATPRYVTIPIANFVALREADGGMLLVTHAACGARGRTDCLFARTLDHEGNARGALSTVRVPEAPQFVHAAARGSEVVYGVLFEHRTPMVVRYGVAPDGALGATIGGGRGRGRGRDWIALGLFWTGDSVRFLSWERVRGDGPRFVMVQTGRPDGVELHGIPEGLWPAALRDTPSGALDLVLHDTDDTPFLVAEVGPRGRLAAPRALPLDRSHVPPPLPSMGVDLRYEPAAFVARFSRTGDDCPPCDEARLAPARRRDHATPAPLEITPMPNGAIALWVDQDGEVDTVFMAHIRCRR
ncbi:MAG: hypothetical protein IPG17_27350 [Sandaracinaceae bacterium]|nr:hypothetical protein [Sandaracinaceae bacterium]MBK8406707.1 hypothetical protein [Sandaracinaceae bacterium]MBK8587691.1 hypothetical protein [Sandaracinaceae bacterium]